MLVAGPRAGRGGEGGGFLFSTALGHFARAPFVGSLNACVITPRRIASRRDAIMQCLFAAITARDEESAIDFGGVCAMLLSCSFFVRLRRRPFAVVP